MTKLIAIAAALGAVAALAACSPREESQDGIQAVTPSDASLASDAMPSEAAPAASEAAQDAAATVTPQPQADLSEDDLAATGMTSRRTADAATAEDVTSQSQ